MNGVCLLTSMSCLTLEQVIASNKTQPTSAAIFEGDPQLMEIASMRSLGRERYWYRCLMIVLLEIRLKVEG
jgi:NADH:ubiquinone oxidoreductase subunit 3 (subunit A)